MRAVLTILVVAAVALAIGLWSLPGARESSVAATVHALGPDAVDAVPLELAAVETQRVASEPEPTRAPVHVPAVKPRATHAVLAGRFVFQDGTVPPPLHFSVLAEPLEAEETSWLILKDARVAPDEGRCVRHAEGRSGADGAFEISGLCARSYRLGQSTFGGLRLLENLFTAPARDLRIVLEGYLLKVLVVDESARPVADAEVAVTFRVGATRERKGRLESKTHQITDAQGTCWFPFPDPGSIEIEASAGLRHASDRHAGVAGPSGVLTRTLVLEGAIQGASLSVRVMECGSAKTPVVPYCLAFFDALDGRRAFRLDSQDAAAGGTFRNLVPGRYRVVLEARSASEPLMHRWSMLPLGSRINVVNQHGEMTWKLIELIDQHEAQLSACVDLGGRVAVRITAASGVDLSGPDPRLELVAEGGSKPLTFRQSDPKRGTNPRLMLTEARLLADQVLDPGTYSLKVIAEGIVAPDQTVIVRGGKITEVDVSLTPERR